MKRGKIGFIFIIVLLIVGVAGYYGLNKTNKADVAFITAEVVRGDLKSIILSTGKVRAVSTINVGTQISGTVKDIYVDYNSIVKKGQLIALIDPATAETDVQQAQAALLSAQADLMEAEATWSNKKQDLSRSRELFSRELIARADLDAGETAVTTAKARVAAARAVIARQSASLKKSQLLLGYTRIYSPVNGVVISRNVDAGQTVAANFNTPTLVEIAEDLSRMQVEVNVDEADIGKIKKGLKVEFTVDSFPDKVFVGSVDQVRIAPKESNDIVSYTVVVLFHNPEKLLMPGMTANVTFIVQEKNDVLKLPNAAFRFRPLETKKKATAGGGMGGMQPSSPSTGGKDSPVAAKKPVVYALKDGNPQKIEVERGISDGSDSEILSGVSEGQKIIVGIEAPQDK